jgi:GNAT superfamily N-acetyltransferase
VSHPHRARGISAAESPQARPIPRMAHPLDSPILAALGSRHARFAQAAGGWLRYRREVAPFAAFATRDAEGAALATLVEPGESVYLLGEEPPVPAGFALAGPWPLAQMFCDAPQPAPDAAARRIVGDGLADVQALAALVYPHYFRPRTPELGRYFGRYDGGVLASMIGERMATDDWQEVSAVCTHPDFLGRGLARGLLAMLGNDILAQGRTPFLHVSQANVRAKDLYLRTGYVERVEIAFWALKRG